MSPLTMPNDKAQPSSQGQEPHDENKYDLEERTAQFGEPIVYLAKTFPRDCINNLLVTQIVRAATSIGANCMQADRAESKKDFRHRISICKEEAKETKHWLRTIAKANPGRRDECLKLLRETEELGLILPSILLSKKK